MIIILFDFTEETSPLNSFTMVKNYIKIAFRNLIKHKFYTFINITGLAIGMACCLLIFLWVKDELSFDRHNTNLDRMYRISTKEKYNGAVEHMALTPAPLSAILKEEIPEVEESTRTYGWINSYKLTYGEKSYKGIKGITADSTLFNVFTIPFVGGDPSSALSQPNSLVIDVSTAKKLFGKEDPIGKTVLWGRKTNLIVSGVMEDMPETSHFKANMFLSMSRSEMSSQDNWTSNNNFFTYVLLNEATDPKLIESKLRELVEKYVGPQLIGEMSQESSKTDLHDAFSFHLQPVKDIHLRSDLKYETDSKGDINYIYLFSAIAAIILLIACINYMNLATARSEERSKEVGLRKTIGALRSQMLVQFLSESLFLSLLGLFLSILLLEFMIPVFNQWSGKSLNPNYWSNMPLLAFMGGIVIVVGLISGSYPAFHLSRFSPIQALKGGSGNRGKGGQLRNILVTLQFTTSIFFLIGTATVYKQLHFVKNTDPGYNKEELLILHNGYFLDEGVESFKQEMLRQPPFKSATVTSYSPVDNISENNNAYFWAEGPKTDEKTYLMNRWWVDTDFQKTLEMKMVQGRFFSQDFPSDSSAAVINESAARILGYENPIGRKINSWNNSSATIVGVVKDFNYKTLRNKIDPLVIYLGERNSMITFRIDGQQTKEAISLLNKKWNEMAPSQDFDYSFLDSEFNSEYGDEERIGEIFTTFSVMAIFIACLGLFGLAAFTAEQRKKEIGVRKVLGATVSGIILLLSKNFGRLLLIAFVLACPLGWWVMNTWLENFQYRTNIGIEVFVLAGLLSFMVAWLTMSYHAYKAATDDPVNAIRYE
ncbi:ABC transporter permease [Xanthovirga aplysinae]|uniref:ABC transporter permease n=1 Tax=Xanthovirga aplysinae TaxID=2529853 RepID=UPI0012BC274E|nr:ABC transporter permease [Xanthovirga aplysinae]MTI30010.1 ABC transporter permease [Xanthovirga aplysinae]